MPAANALTIRSGICQQCRFRQQADGVCSRTGLHAMSAVVRGATCPIGKHGAGEMLHWVRGAWAAFKTWAGLTPQYRYKAARLRVCNGCDRNDKGTCRACGCNVELKAADESQSCPLDKWEQ